MKECRAKFPPNAYELASSRWWFDFNEHRCPHDAWLERFEVSELSSGERSEVRSSELKIVLLGAYHDQILTLRYQGVAAIAFEGSSIKNGHGDWRYDEFRVSETGMLIHEIEWHTNRQTARWQIEAKDVEFTADPRGNAA